MKTYSKILYEKHYTSPIAYGYDATHIVESYIKITIHFDFKEGLRFSVSIPNRGYCGRNLIKVLLEALESEGIGYAKYQRLKEDCRKQKFWNSLDPDYKAK